VSAADAARAAIDAAGGAIPFDRFMALALYGEQGFYATGGAGRREGHFLTSPEVGPLFGAVLARFLDATWERLGRPCPFIVVDAGAGPGTLARAVLAAVRACADALRYVAVEVSAGQRGGHPEAVETRRDFPDVPFDGVVVANELLDNLPFRLAVFDGGWREAYVAADGQRFVEVLSAPFDPVPAVLPDDAPHGGRAPLLDDATSWLTTARRVVRTGAVVVVDYTRPSTAELVRRPWRDWLRTYRRHARGGHYLADPGSQDLTVDVPLDQLPAADATVTQADWLRRHGLDDLVAEGDRAWAAAAARPDVAAMAMRSRRREAEALTDPFGLGGFTVAEWWAPSA
jgi:SAM-dependent MidA family methyltransferase